VQQQQNQYCAAGKANAQQKLAAFLELGKKLIRSWLDITAIRGIPAFLQPTIAVLGASDCADERPSKMPAAPAIN
jgi:hypothetical protein